jgi:hypothetical protein
MTTYRRTLAVATASAAAAAGLALAAPPAMAALPSPGPDYVLSNQVDGNAVIAFPRSADGTLAAPTPFTSFRITPHGLVRVDAEPSNGDRPTSVTVDGDLLYVLNAGGNDIPGFRVDGGDLTPVAGSTQPTSGPTAAPGQVSFTPDGAQLIVAERGTQLLGVHPVDADGVAGEPVLRPVLRRGAVRLRLRQQGPRDRVRGGGRAGRQRRVLVRDR